MAEIIASRTTENGETLVLKRRKSDRFNGSQYEYYVTESGSDARTDQYERTREDGMRQLRKTVELRNKYDDDKGGGGPSLPGMGGGGGMPGLGGGGGGGSPGIPGLMGGMDKDDDDDEDTGFNFPGF